MTYKDVKGWNGGKIKAGIIVLSRFNMVRTYNKVVIRLYGMAWCGV